jgi:hypothetical protein
MTTFGRGVPFVSTTATTIGTLGTATVERSRHFVLFH